MVPAELLAGTADLVRRAEQDMAKSNSLPSSGRTADAHAAAEQDIEQDRFTRSEIADDGLSPVRVARQTRSTFQRLLASCAACRLDQGDRLRKGVPTIVGNDERPGATNTEPFYRRSR